MKALMKTKLEPGNLEYVDIPMARAWPWPDSDEGDAGQHLPDR